MSVVTLLFTDLVGSTELLSRLDESANERMRSAHFALLRDAIALHGGEEVKSLGDGVMAAFGSTSDAVASAVAIQQAAERYSSKYPDAPLSIRIGLDVGEPSRTENDYFGAPVVVASRLCAEAGGGQILVTDTVRAIAGARGFAFTEAGERALKGIEGPVRAYEVRWDPLPPEIPMPAALAARTGRFVGRGGELTHLADAFERCRQSRTFVLVAGEPGIGKTSLLSEFAAAAHASGAVVLFGRCDEEALVPYQPFVESLRHYAAASVPEELPGELVRILPELAERGVAAPPRAEPETERYRLFEAVASALAGAAEKAPTVLVLDDLHWADKPSLMLLNHVLRAGPGARLMIVGAYRDVELDRRHPLADVLADLRKEGAFERLVLRGISEPDIEAWLEASAGHELDARASALARALHAETEGNPLFVREILRHLVESGALFERDGRWTSDLTVEQVGLPEGVKEVIGRRLARLSDACNDALRVASVIGREFNLDVLERTSEQPTDRLLALLEEAVNARIVEEAPGALDRYWFSHALIRETLHEELTTSRRVRLHRKVGEALEGSGAGLGEIAYHYFESAVLDGGTKALEYARRAGRYATDVAAYEESAAQYARAIHALDVADRPDEAQRLELLLERGMALMRAGEMMAGREVVREAVELARKLGDAEGLGRASLIYSHGFQWIEMGRVDDYMKGLLDEALAGLGDADGALGAMVRARLASEILFAGPLEEERRFALCDEALAMAKRIGDPEAIFYVHRIRRTSVLWEPTAGRARLAEDEEVIALARRVGSREAEANCLLGRAMSLLMIGDRDAYDADLDSLESLADDLRQPVHRWFAMQLRAGQALLEGRFADARVVARRALEIGAPAVGANARLWWLCQESQVLYHTGGLDEIMPRIEEVVATSGIPIMRVTAAWYRAAAGGTAGAAAAFDALAAEDFPVWRDGNHALGLIGLAWACWLLEDAKGAAAMYARMLPCRDAVGLLGGATVCLGSFEMYLGMTAATAGDHATAVEHLERALPVHERLRSPPLVAQARFLLAASLAALGQSQPARSELARATETFARLGMAPWLERAAAMSAALPG